MHSCQPQGSAPGDSGDSGVPALLCRRLTLLLSLVLSLLSSCVGGGAPDPQRLALLPPLPYRIAIGGGALLGPEQRDEAGAALVDEDRVLRTFDGRDIEPIALQGIVRSLQLGNLASAVIVLDEEDPLARERLAFGAVGSEAAEQARLQAERAGADILLILEGLRDAPVIELGINGRWPVATVAWLLVGLGMFIPDHSFESQVGLRASLRDVHSGAVLIDELVIAPGSVDLSLIERSTWVGILSSILIPPPLVSSSPEDYVNSVRSTLGDLVALRLLATLKTPETLERLRRALPVGVELLRSGGGSLELVVRSDQDLLSVAVEIGEERRALGEEQIASLLSRLRASRAADPAGEGSVYRAELRELGQLERRSLVRVLVGTVAGQRASTSLRVREP